MAVIGEKKSCCRRSFFLEYNKSVTVNHPMQIWALGWVRNYNIQHAWTQLEELRLRTQKMSIKIIFQKDNIFFWIDVILNILLSSWFSKYFLPTLKILNVLCNFKFFSLRTKFFSSKIKVPKIVYFSNLIPKLLRYLI